MSKFILINEELSLNNKKKWKRNQNHRIDKVLSKSTILSSFIIKDSSLKRKAVVEVEDVDVGKFSTLNHIVYADKTYIPNIVPVELVWDCLSIEEKNLFLSSNEIDVIRFKMDLNIRTFFNVNNQEFINAINRLQALGIISEGKALFIFNKFKL